MTAQQARRSTLRYAITQKFVDALPVPHPSGKVTFYAERPRGFAVDVNTASKSFVIRTSFNKKVTVFTIGRCSDMKVDEARKIAEDWLAKIHRGEDPRPPKPVATPIPQPQPTELTFLDWHNRYLQKKQKRKVKGKEVGLRVNTLRKYGYAMAYLKDWWDKPLSAITPEMVEERLDELWSVKGAHTAHDTFTHYVGVWNLASKRNPTLLALEGPSETLEGLWPTLKANKCIIPDDRLAEYMVAAKAVEYPAFGDYVDLLLATGLRVSEASKLQWDEVDFDKDLIVLQPERHKSGDRTEEPFVVPLNSYAADVLRKRWSEREALPVDERSVFVFPARFDPSLPLTNTYKYFGDIRKATGGKDKGIKSSNHCFRRMLMTVGTDIGVPDLHVKKLMNHTVPDSDYHNGYWSPKLEPVRASSQRIADWQFGLAYPKKAHKRKAKQVSNVIDMKAA
ncbi:integrase family protein [Mesorhizobium sp. M2C.T.Ca.TU.002.02.1.1]|uniref:tyrosine-type recombinase/integrase n=1 Tax=Mesorhizobium sp. M2C.T.Ca.TU.002.02.1.1 TaxID=2496788 RepID=UPI000FCAADFE|nr:integrase family protein [Mesorhizobium sp. M2C.T.Ca.TU.002.02.1.1]RUU59453.1 DUF4102 domain-containing protein [Mesorhizobium sp. M2C.T.Ca.TU.002.02.1.1]RUU69424.1 DUF4102 domain-containing protein [Mesorhizobium sp. M2C.T.Ca.TU.009.01.2.1]